MQAQKTLNMYSVRSAYRRWAPIYDLTFGVIASAGRRKSVELINQRRGSVLEVGVGTGLSLPNYAPYLKITGIDLSPEMLAKARERVEKDGLRNIEALYEMDASNLDFADDSFNTVVAMYVMTVVPDPERVMAELERVCAPGGEVMIVNHFSQDEGARGWVERKMAPLCRQARLASGVPDRARHGTSESVADRTQAALADGPVYARAVPQAQGYGLITGLAHASLLLTHPRTLPYTIMLILGGVAQLVRAAES